MAQSKGNMENIQDLSAVEVEVEGQDEPMEIAPGAVQSVTTETPHPADESSQPGPYDGLEVNRPPVSTNRPDVPIAHSLVAGAGAPSEKPEYRPELGPDQEGVPRVETAYLSSEDKKAGNVVDAEGKPKK